MRRQATHVSNEPWIRVPHLAILKVDSARLLLKDSALSSLKSTTSSEQSQGCGFDSYCNEDAAHNQPEEANEDCENP